MNLTESQLFTIEALNRIEGFVWPKGAEFYEVDGGHIAYFYGDASGAMASFRIKEAHDKTVINETVTKAEFDSVDGWVRVGGVMPHGDCDVDIEFNDRTKISKVKAKSVAWENTTSWRYHKPKKENGMPEKVDEQQSIERLYDEYRKACIKLDEAKETVAWSTAQRDEALAKIKSWHKERGFDVSESSGEPFIRNCGLNDRFPDYRHKPLVNFGSSDVKPKLNPIVKADVKLESELKITDWRDLRVGDEVKATRVKCVPLIEGCAGVIVKIDAHAVHGPLFVDFGKGERWWVKEWEFIRRP